MDDQDDPFRLEDPDEPEPKPQPPPPSKPVRSATPEEGNGHEPGVPFGLAPSGGAPVGATPSPPVEATPPEVVLPDDQVPEIFLSPQSPPPEPFVPQESFTTAVPRVSHGAGKGGARRGRGGEEPEVSLRTVAERRGKAVIIVRGVRPPPPGWPLEALRFPLRAPGPFVVLSLAPVLGFLDALAATPLGFLGLILKVPLLVFLVRWLLHEVGMSAGGRDNPMGYTRVLDLDGAAVRGFLGLLAVATLLLLPGAIAWWVDGEQRVALVVTLFVAGSAWLAVAMLGAAVGDPGLAWPWRATEWLVRRPLPFLVGAAAPWALGTAEASAFAAADRPFLTALAIGVGVRLLVLYAWLVSARAIGVAGRTWTPPWEKNPIED